MSYDFHLDENQNLKLIEINTNASSSLVVDLQYKRMNIENPAGVDFQKEIIQSFRDEFSLSGGSGLKTIAIIDDKPAQQKMYIEFEMFAELFRKAGFKVIIGDPSDFKFSRENKLVHNSGTPIDLVYNRHTDFYLLTVSCGELREAYRSLATCFSPNPREYALLADKQRLQEISKDGVLESLGVSAASIAAIRSCLLKSYSLHEFTHDEAWAQRKKFFFKPARAFGGKAAYKGSSISRGPFEQLWEGDTIAQEFVAAPEIMLPVEAEDGKIAEQKFKFDLRFYVYKAKIQLCNARVYQGQTTNATTAGGGLTPVVFS